MPVNQMKKLIHEILEEANGKRSKADRVAVLLQYNSMALRDVLKGSFDDTIVWMLPEGTPPYTKCRDESIPTNLYKIHRQLAYLCEHGPGMRMTPAKREGVFIKILEGINSKDSEVICAMKDKKLDKLYKRITKEVVKEAFPKLIVL